jgi:hypothetical protein
MIISLTAGLATAVMTALTSPELPACETASRAEPQAVIRRALERTGLDSADGRVLRVTGFDLRSHAAESDRWYGPALLDVTDFDEWFRPHTAVTKRREHTSIAGFQYGDATILSDERAAFVLTGDTLKPSEQRHGESWSSRPLNVWAVLLDWAAARDVRVTSRCVYRDYARLVLSRRGLRGDERLYVDEKSGYPVKLDREEPHYLWGQVHVEYLYSTWRLIDGVHLPGGSFRIVDGVPEVTRVFAAIHVAPTDTADLVIPTVAIQGFPADAFMVPTRPDTIRVGPATFLLRNAGFTEAATLAHDTVFLFDATQGDERARQDANWLTTLFPGQHAVVVVVSDLAFPHIAGVRYWVAHGATIASRTTSRALLERVISRRWTRDPDELERARSRVHLRFRPIRNSATFAGGDVDVFPIDGAASEGALAVFLRQDRFLWASDFIQDLDDPTQYLDETAAAVCRARVEPVTFAAEHLGLSRWSRATTLVRTPCDSAH